MTETISVPRDLLLELRDSANDCYNNEVRRYKDDRRRIIYKALVDKADELLAAAPKAEQPPVQKPARNPDVLALNAAREIMALVYGPTPLGGSPQLLAQIQCVVSEAIVYAAPQPSDDARDAARYRWLRHMTTKERTYIVQQEYDKVMDMFLDESMKGGRNE